MGRENLSSSLSYLNSLLCSLGIKPFRAQYVLLAAANHPSATIPVLSFLWDLIVFHLASPPPSNSNHSQSTTADKVADSQIYPKSHARHESNAQRKKDSHVIHRGSLTLDDVDIMPDFNTSAEEKLCFVKFYLAVWGYAPNSPFFMLDSETKESRHFLLALGWLISYSDVFNRALQKYCSELIGKNTPAVTNSYLDISAMERGRAAGIEAEKYVAKVLEASKRLGQNRARTKALGEQVLMLNGRLKMRLRSLHALTSYKVKQSHELNQIQVENNVSSPSGHPFSPFELHLLEHHKTLEKYCQTLEMTKCMIEGIVECNQHESNFWKWMSEVAAEARQDLPQQNDINMDQHNTDSSGSWTTNLLSVVNHAGTQLNGFCSADGGAHFQTGPTSKGKNNATSAREIDLVSTSVMAMWEDLQDGNIQTIKRTHDEDPDTPFIEVFGSLQNHLLPKESAGTSDFHCLDEKQFKSVKDIARMLVSTLARIRVNNRALIEDSLKEWTENKDYLFAGL